MSWTTKYRSEFNDIYGVAWKVDIEEDSWGGAITELTALDDALTISWENITDDIFDPIKTSTAELTILSETNFAIADIYATQDLQFRMSIYQNDILYWRGYVSSRDYKEPYDEPPYPVTINAICGLGFLNDYLYCDGDPSIAAGVTTITYFDGYRLESQIILDILGNIGYTGFTEFINIYEDSHLTTASDSPLNQTAINVDAFKGMYCQEVLAAILKSYNASIIHKGGQFYIYRPKEITGATVYGRVFTSATTKTATTFTPLQYIDRATNPSTLRQIDGGVMMITRPAKYVSVFQNYVARDSWLDNYKIEGYTFSGSIALGDNAEEWTKVGMGSPGTLRISRWLPFETDGIVITDQNSYPTTSKYIKQEFGYNAVTSADTFILQFDYQWISGKGSTAVANEFYFSLEDTAGTKWLSIDDGYSCSWTSGSNLMTIQEDVLHGFNGWKTWTRQIVGLEANGPYIIKFYALDDSEVIYVGIKNVIFTQAHNKIIKVPNAIGFLRAVNSINNGGFYLNYNNEDIGYEQPTRSVELSNVIERTYDVDNGIEGQILKYNYMVGDVTDAGIDNILEQFNGALEAVVRDTLTTVASNFVTDHAGDYSGGGVAVTSVGAVLSFTGQTTATKVSGDDFTGSTTITNTDGNLSGTVSAYQAYITSVARIDKIYPTDDAGSADIVVDGLTAKVMTFDTDQETTCSNFVTAQAAFYSVEGITITYGQESVDHPLYPEFWYVQFQAVQAGNDFTGATTITPQSPGELDGTVVTDQANVVGQARIDKITLTGVDGTANILCDGVTQEAKVTETVSATSTWESFDGTHTGNGEDKELLKIIGDEIAAQYARPKQLVQMPIMETGSAASTLNVIGYFQDDLNTYESTPRKFVFNRGSFDTKYRKWNVDLCEVI